jgi:hypothetical protein
VINPDSGKKGFQMMAHSDGRKRYPFDGPGKYRIRVQGSLDESWSERLAGMRVTSSNPKEQGPVTMLVGQLRDHAELARLLNSLYERHLTILLVEYLDE